jgi:hypothetical protein
VVLSAVRTSGRRLQTPATPPVYRAAQNGDQRTVLVPVCTALGYDLDAALEAPGEAAECEIEDDERELEVELEW